MAKNKKGGKITTLPKKNTSTKKNLINSLLEKNYGGDKSNSSKIIRVTHINMDACGERCSD